MANVWRLTFGADDEKSACTNTSNVSGCAGAMWGTRLPEKREEANPAAPPPPSTRALRQDHPKDRQHRGCQILPFSPPTRLGWGLPGLEGRGVGMGSTNHAWPLSLAHIFPSTKLGGAQSLPKNCYSADG